MTLEININTIYAAVMNKRVIGFLSILSLSLYLPLIPVNAAAKAGGGCSKAGLTSVVSGKTFTCIKSGKKMVWDKGVKVVVPNPLPINSFSELPARFADVKYIAWTATQKAIASSEVQEPLIEIKVSANTTKYSNKTTDAVRLVQKAFNKSTLPKKVWMIYYNSNDQVSTSWASTEFSQIMGKSVIPNPLSPRTSSSHEAVVPLSLANDDYTKSGGTEAHEYLHAVQFEQFVGSTNSPYAAPRWMFEGGGQFIQDYMMYGSNYQDWVLKTSAKQLKTYDLKFFQDFLTYNFPITYGPDGDPWFYTSQWPNQRVYDVGSLVYQVLIAVNGPTPVVNLFKDVSQTGNFDSSFKNVYGVSWSDAKPLVAKAIFGMVNI
jgi:hypothetical protein